MVHNLHKIGHNYARNLILSISMLNYIECQWQSLLHLLSTKFKLYLHSGIDLEARMRTPIQHRKQQCCGKFFQDKTPNSEVMNTWQDGQGAN